MKKLDVNRGERLLSQGCVMSIYSHKGGVGKTTTTLHLARTMKDVHRQEKIVLVDLDAQMNLTHQLCTIGLRIDGEEIDFEEMVDKMSQIDYATRAFLRQDAHDIVTLVAKAEKDPKLPIEIKPAKCSLTNLHEVDCILGNMDHSHVLYKLTRERNDNMPSHMFSALKNVIDKLAEEYDIVLMDLPPDMFELNKTLLRCSDYIVTVLNTDIFALVTSRMINRKLMREMHSEYYAELKKPKLLGFVMNRVKFMKGRLVTQNQKHMNKAEEYWRDTLSISLPILGCIPDFETQLKQETENYKCLVHDVRCSGNKSKSIVESYESLLQGILQKIRKEESLREEGEVTESSM